MTDEEFDLIIKDIIRLLGVLKKPSERAEKKEKRMKNV